MKKLTIIYSPQCPWNLHFMEKIKVWTISHDVKIQEINVFDQYEKAKSLLNNTAIGYTTHMFIAVFVDGKLVPGHPGNPEFKNTLQKVLKGAINDQNTSAQ